MKKSIQRNVNVATRRVDEAVCDLYVLDLPYLF